MKTLTSKNLYRYTKNKYLKNDIENKTCIFAYHIDQNDYENLKKYDFDNCYVYKIKEYFYSLKKTKTSYYINFINKRIYNDFYTYNKDHWKFKNCYYFYKLKDFYNEKTYYENNNYFIDYTYDNKKFYNKFYKNYK